MKKCYPIYRLGTRELSVKKVGIDSKYILFEYHIPQAIDIKLEITPEEIEMLYKCSQEFQEQYFGFNKKKREI